MRTTDQELAHLRDGVKWRAERIKRLEELNTDLAGEVDRLWHEKLTCPQCGTEVQFTEPILKEK